MAYIEVKLLVPIDGSARVDAALTLADTVKTATAKFRSSVLEFAPTVYVGLELRPGRAPEELPEFKAPPRAADRD